MINDPELAEELKQRVAVAAEIRRLTHGLIGHDPTTDEMRALAEQLRAHADELEAAPTRRKDLTRWIRPDAIISPGEGEYFWNSPDRPVSGKGNPWSIPLDVRREGESVVTDVNFGPALEGAPTRAHGAVISAMYDDLFGFLLMMRQSMAFTAWLKVEFVAGTPVGEDITFRGWIEEVERRKLFISGECVDAEGNTLTTATALFIEQPNMTAENSKN